MSRPLLARAFALVRFELANTSSVTRVVLVVFDAIVQLTVSISDLVSIRQCRRRNEQKGDLAFFLSPSPPPSIHALPPLDLFN